MLRTPLIARWMMSPLTLVCSVAVLMFGGCASSQSAAPAPGTTHQVAAAPAVTHVVLISLMDPSQAGELEADCRAKLSRIPSVTLHGCGPHVDIGRANIDGRYDIGVIVGFDSIEGYRAYLEHPLHEELVATWKPRWRDARIFDVGDSRALAGAGRP